MPSPPAAGPTVEDGGEGHEFVRLEALRGRWPIPEELERAVSALGAALVAGDPAAIDRWLAPSAVGVPDLQDAATRGGLEGVRIVACARIGEHRVVKVRLDGPGTSVALLGRWASAPGGWRMVFAETTRTDLARPA
jgi:hypothetical protein